MRKLFIYVACFFVEFFVSKDEHFECKFYDSIFVFLFFVKSFSEFDFFDSIVDFLEEKTSKIKNSFSNLCIFSSKIKSSNVSNLEKNHCVKKKIRFFKKSLTLKTTLRFFVKQITRHFRFKLNYVLSFEFKKKD